MINQAKPLIESVMDLLAIVSSQLAAKKAKEQSKKGFDANLFYRPINALMSLEKYLRNSETADDINIAASVHVKFLYKYLDRSHIDFLDHRGVFATVLID